ncbi:hypothetical protein [Aegicerativicinus sediminis]
MKFHNFILIIVVLVLISGCKQSEDNDVKLTDNNLTESNVNKTDKQSDGLILFTGDFLYFDNAAVLNTGQTVYGVVVNEKMRQLDSLVQPFKSDPTDMISVGIRGKLIPKAENVEGWDYSIEVEEIVNVYPDEDEEAEAIVN